MQIASFADWIMRVCIISETGSVSIFRQNLTELELQPTVGLDLLLEV
jgi:hypothetical protein